ncbi:hypothetical protein [Atopobacter phocae]|uniref:hypothetical protein n=1 Tax=Atopobacter phocae TaxID=136492 RepID=UPI00146FC419|nr:hypothetical protein [Atopobacter phocae]
MRLVTPQIRIVEPRYHRLVPYPDNLVDLYRIYGKTDSLDHLPFYKATFTSEKFHLLGFDDKNAYIEVTGEVCILPLRKISFEDKNIVDLKEPSIIIIANHYHLTDPSYEQLGFINPNKQYVINVKTALENKNLKYQVDSNKTYRRLEWRIVNEYLFNDFLYTRRGDV